MSSEVGYYFMVMAGLFFYNGRFCKESCCENRMPLYCKAVLKWVRVFPAFVFREGKMNSEIFEKLPPTKLLLRCGIPAMVTMAFGALYQIADGLFVGRFIGGDALAAVNLIMPVIMMAFALSDMVAAGASVRISIFSARKRGKKRHGYFQPPSRVSQFTSLAINSPIRNGW